MSQFDNLRNKAESWAKDNPDTVEQYSDQAGGRVADAADKATGGKHSDLIGKGRQKADDLVGRDGDEASSAAEARRGEQP